MSIVVYNEKKEKIGTSSSVLFDFLSSVKVDYSFLNRHFVKTKKEKYNLRLSHTKTISEVSGTTKKPHAQKGGGRSRQGSKRSNQHVGGGCVFGPKFHKIGISINSKEKSLAKIYAIADRFLNDSLFVSNVDISQYKKSKDFISLVKNYNTKSILFVDSLENSKKVNPRYFSNLQCFQYAPVNNLTCFSDISSFEVVVLSESCLNELISSLVKWKS